MLRFSVYLKPSLTLTLLRPMEFPIKFDTVKSEWSVVYIERLQVIISKENISFSEGRFCLS